MFTYHLISNHAPLHVACSVELDGNIHNLASNIPEPVTAWNEDVILDEKCVGISADELIVVPPSIVGVPVNIPFKSYKSTDAVNAADVDSIIVLNQYVLVPVPLYVGSKYIHPKDCFDELIFEVERIPAIIGIV